MKTPFLSRLFKNIFICFELFLLVFFLFNHLVPLCLVSQVCLDAGM